MDPSRLAEGGATDAQRPAPLIADSPGTRTWQGKARQRALPNPSPSDTPGALCPPGCEAESERAKREKI